ncbi:MULTISPECIES: HAD family hydrolase [Halorussus]|uniref:HAD family hydrolase n=1 Tax=Halorussus TaxID=1070314 RepID=UPI000E20D872|nr:MULTISPECIES: HAD family hydrolase [Halorussus]NHN59892.1 HAD family hydrolase [Halorussus sp. JP-T4]
MSDDDTAPAGEVPAADSTAADPVGSDGSAADVDAVLFDLDGTLVEYERSPAELLDLAFESVGVDPFFDATAYFDRYDDHLGPGVSIAEGRANCFAAIAADRGRDPDLGRRVADAFAAKRDHSRVEHLPGAVEAVDALAADHALGVVTNGPPEMQATKLAAAGLADRFETVVFAGHDAAAKPDPEPFEVALADLGAAADRAVHVGNSLSSDVAGAHAAGLRSVWVPAESGVEPVPEPHHALSSLERLAGSGRPPWVR